MIFNNRLRLEALCDTATFRFYITWSATEQVYLTAHFSTLFIYLSHCYNATCTKFTTVLYVYYILTFTLKLQLIIISQPVLSHLVFSLPAGSLARSPLWMEMNSNTKLMVCFFPCTSSWHSNQNLQQTENRFSTQTNYMYPLRMTNVTLTTIWMKNAKS